jgi:transposase
LIAAIGKAETFAHARDLAVWLGFVPRQSTTGGKPRGNKYLRKLVIHGARSAKALFARAHPNVAAVALANKLARICWAARG